MHVPSPHLQHLAKTPATLEFTGAIASASFNAEAPAKSIEQHVMQVPAPTPKTDSPPAGVAKNPPRAQKLEETLSRLADPETGQLGHDLVVHHGHSVDAEVEAPEETKPSAHEMRLAVREAEPTAAVAAKITPQSTPEFEPLVANCDQISAPGESINEEAAQNTSESIAQETAAQETQETAVQKPNGFQAEWEVDHFRWPEETTALAGAIEKQNEALTQDGQLSSWVAVSGASQRAGASTLTLSLARHMARQGSSVVVVDANFANPQLAEMLGMQVQDGWEKALAGEAKLDQVAIVSLEDGIVLLPLRKTSTATATNANLVAAQRLVALRENFDVILIDVGTGTENLAAVATTQDETLPITTLVITDTRQRQASATQETITHLRLAGIDSIHLVENFASA